MNKTFEKLVARFRENRAVSVGTGFGKSRGLRVGGKIFAIFGESELVVKLPKERVDELVESGVGTRFDPRRDGRIMKEWVTVAARHARRWNRLVDEAFEFVSAEDSTGDSTACAQAGSFGTFSGLFGPASAH